MYIGPQREILPLGLLKQVERSLPLPTKFPSKAA